MGKEKKVKSNFNKDNKKEIPENLYKERKNEPILWKLGKMVLDSDRKWNWIDLKKKDYLEIHLKLSEIEKLTYNELDKKKHHPLDVSVFYEKNKEVIKELEILKYSGLVERLHTLRLNGKKRIICMYIGNVFELLWYDSEHEVYPCYKKHT